MAELEILTFFATLFALILSLLQLKYQGQDNVFQEHPMTARFTISSLILCWFLLGVKLKYPGLYEIYLCYVPFGVDFFGSLSMASTASLLLPEPVRPLVYFVCFVLAAPKTLYRVFTKLEARFGETEFWRTSVDPALCILRRRVNRIVQPVVGQTIHIIPL